MFLRTRQRRSSLESARWPFKLNRNSPQALGLVAWYPMLPRGGNKLLDLSGNGHHGTLTNMEPEDWEITNFGGQSLGFDGSDEHVVLDKLGNYGSEMGTNKPCVSFWIQTTSTASGWVLGMRNAPGGTRLDCRINEGSASSGTGRINGILDGNGGSTLNFGIDTDTGITDGQPHHVSISFDAADPKIFVDGFSQTIATSGTPDTFVNFTRNMFIGGFNDGGAPLTPIVANLWDIRFYNRIPTDAERVDLWAKPGDIVQETGKISYFFVPPAVGGVNIVVPLGIFTKTGQVPIVGSGALIAAPLKTFTKTGFIPSINTGVNIITPLGTFILTGFVPIVTAGGIIIVTPLGSFTVNFLVPSVASGVSVNLPLKTFILIKFVPIIGSGVSIIIPLKIFSLTGFIPSVDIVSFIIDVPLKQFNLTKFIPAIHAVIPASRPLTEIDLTPPFEDITQMRYLHRNFALLRDMLDRGVTGQFTTTDGKTIHIRNGVVVDIF